MFAGFCDDKCRILYGFVLKNPYKFRRGLQVVLKKAEPYKYKNRTNPVTWRGGGVKIPDFCVT